MKKRFISLMLATLVLASNCAFAKGHPKKHPPRGGHANIHAHAYHPAPPPPRYVYHYHPSRVHYGLWYRSPGCSHFFPFLCGCSGGRFSLNFSI